MKKTLLIFAAMTFLVACNKELFDIAQPVPVETNGIKISLSVTRHDSFGSTKATVKSEWADDDVIFVFFKGVTAPKYLEMKYDSGSDTWTPMAKNGLISSDLSDAADKKMTAVYLPYGSTATVAASEGNFIFSDFTYSGYFLKAELVTYTYGGDVLSGTLNMTAPELSSGSDKLIHFDISGFTSGHDYKLYQDYVKPLTFTSVSSAGVISTNEGAMGAAITGYEDGSMMSFSGILDASVVGNAADYQFSIDDLTSSILYTRDAGSKTVSTSKYIGIGAINNAEVWKSFEYVDLGLSVRWAKYNVGSTTPEGYGDYFAWGDVETYYEAGYVDENPQEHWKNGKSDGYSWSTYKWCDGSYTTLTKYCDDLSKGKDGFADYKACLDPEDDAAHINWKGSWRMPTKAEQDELVNNCTWVWTILNGVNGYLITSNIPGYTERSIFLPASGAYSTTVDQVGIYGLYWASTIGSGYSDFATYILFSSIDDIDDYHTHQFSRYYGHSVRPVIASDGWISTISINMLSDNQTLITDDRMILNVDVRQNGEETVLPVIWSSDNPSVAGVTQDGEVIAISGGVAHITASIQSKSAQCTVTVIEESEIEHEYVDLGLSVKWATFNVGAVNPEGFGKEYAWGETKPRGSSYKWGTIGSGWSPTNLTKYNNNISNGIVDDKIVLDPEDDVAHVKWGGDWRMPTNEEQAELLENCSWVWTSLNGVDGYSVTSNISGYEDHSIFLPSPVSCYYWSGSLNTDKSTQALVISLTSGSQDARKRNRNLDAYVRPVCP